MIDLRLLALVLLIAFFILIVALRYFYGKLPQLWLPNENFYVDPNLNDARFPFPSLFALPSPSNSVYLSVIIPAYNEEKRLPVMLEATLKSLKERQKNDKSFTWEIIIVDDGSRDSTTKVGHQYGKQETTERVRVLTLLKNRGKGGAVKRGMMCARGRYLLMVDADGATEFSDLSRLEKETKAIEKNECSLVIGSRAHLVDEAVAKRTFFRNILMWGFHTLVSVLGVRGVKDTQCGFKLFSRRAAQLLFPNLHIERWAFDVELIYLAQQLGIPLKEVAVNWREIEGSKLNPVSDSVQMGKDILKIRSGYMFRIWTIDPNRTDASS